MKVKELIEKLKEMPQEAEVYHRYHTNYADIYGSDTVQSIEIDNDGDVILK